jgi:hypothetical protein
MMTRRSQCIKKKSQLHTIKRERKKNIQHQSLRIQTIKDKIRKKSINKIDKKKILANSGYEIKKKLRLWI